MRQGREPQGRRSQGSGATKRRLCSRFPVRRRDKSADWRKARLSARGGFRDARPILLRRLALAPFARESSISTRRWVVLTREKATFVDASGSVVQRAKRPLQAGSLMVDKGNYRHTWRGNSRAAGSGRRTLAHLSRSRQMERCACRLILVSTPRRFHGWTISACGTAFTAGLWRVMLERFARLFCGHRHRLGVSLPGGAVA